MTTVLLLSIVLVPLALALPALLPGLRRWSLGMTVAGTLPALAGAWLLPSQTVNNSPIHALGMVLGMDPIGHLFLAFTAAVWLLAAVHTMGTLRHDARRGRFAAAFLLTMAGNFGVTIAQDAVSFYAFFAMMSFASYALVVHDGSAFARRAGLTYIVLVVAGELMIFPGMAAASHAAKSLELATIRTAWSGADAPHAAMLLLFLGFAIKAGIAPLHVWLPLAHPAAPTPASAVLSGCMIKAGLLGWLRFLPLGEVAMPNAYPWAVALGIVTMLGGLAVGLTQDHPKALLAYSSISKMGTLLLLISVAMALPEKADAVALAAGLYAGFHAFNKGALFLGCNVTPGLDPASRRGRLALVGLVFLALSFAGAPLLAGAAAKLPLKYALAYTDLGHSPWMKGVLALTTFATALLMGRFVALTRPGRRPPTYRADPLASRAWAAAVLAVLAYPGFAAVTGHLDRIASAYGKSALGGHLPLLLAIGVVAASCRWRWPWPVALPPGDLLTPLARLMRLMRRPLSNAFVKVLIDGEPISARLAEAGGVRLQLEKVSRRLEDALANSPAGGAIFVLITVLLMLALMLGA